MNVLFEMRHRFVALAFTHVQASREGFLLQAGSLFDLSLKSGCPPFTTRSIGRSDLPNWHPEGKSFAPLFMSTSVSLDAMNTAASVSFRPRRFDGSLQPLPAQGQISLFSQANSKRWFQRCFALWDAWCLKESRKRYTFNALAP